MIKRENIKYWRIAVLCICIATFFWFLWALCNLPSKDMYNPHQADERQYGSQSYTMPPPCVDAVTKTHCEHTTREVEQYTADRSALAAQWASADITHLTYYAGLLGISLIVLTFFETYVAGRLVAQQNQIAMNSTRPFLVIISAYVRRGSNDSFEFEIAVRNLGESVATDVYFEGVFEKFMGTDDNGVNLDGPPIREKFKTGKIAIPSKSLNVISHTFDGWNEIESSLLNISDWSPVSTKKKISQGIKFVGDVAFSGHAQGEQRFPIALHQEAKWGKKGYRLSGAGRHRLASYYEKEEREND